MKGKKLLSLLLAAVLSMSLFLFTACGGQQTPQTPGPQIEQDGGNGDDPGTSGGSGDDTGKGDATGTSESGGSGGSEEVPPPAHVHSAQHTAAVAPTCTTAGNVDYWYCSGCGKYFSDGECTEEIMKDDTVAEATHHLRVPLLKHDREEATCTEHGNILYYECQDCHEYFDSETATHEISQNDTVIPKGHAVPTTYQTSETEHWYVCEKCEEEQRGEHVYSSSNECDICGYTLQFTEGLKYTNIDENTCRVTGIGTATAETNIIIPVVYDGRKVVKIDYQAFKGCSGITSITIPASVTSIGNYAFYECSNLTSITIPASVTSIGYSAFNGCTGLQTVTFDGESKLESIGSSAFYNCSNLTSITIPASVTFIGSESFYDCSSLTSITIPASVTSIGERAFYGCTNLQPSITENNVDYLGNSENRYLYLWKVTDKTITNFTINARTKFIGDSSFYNCSSLTSITIPASVTSIGDDAFHWCSSLTSITIPASVTSIGGGAFSGCANLHTVNWNATNCTEAGSEYSNIFYNCTALTTVNIGENVKTIPAYAFYGCSKLASITIPASVTSIGNYAFRNCSSITSITIPANVTSIGSSAFQGCSSLTEITIPFVGTKADGSGKFKDIFNSVPSSLKTVIITGGDKIAERAFENCKVTSITIPASVTSIGANAFGNCTNLKTVNWNATNCTTAGSSSRPIFSGCTLLTTVNIGANVETIPDYAFYYCTNLYKVTIASDSELKTIGEWAFRDCSLMSITIPASVTSIGDMAFYGCYNLIEVCNDSSLIIGDWKIDYSYVGQYAIHVYSSKNGSSKLKTRGEYIFYEDSEKNEYYLVKYTGHQKEISLPEIGHEYGIKMAFDRDNIENVIVPESVTAIGDSAFENCTKLQTVTFAGDSKLESIGRYAFYGCRSLTSIKIPASVTTIGDNAFKDCSNLQTVTFAETNGWEVSQNSDMSSPTTLSSEQLQDETTAANYLKSYYNYYWQRS